MIKLTVLIEQGETWLDINVPITKKKGVLDMKNNTNLEVIRIDSAEDVAAHFTPNEERDGLFRFRDQSYTGGVEITKNGAIALRPNWDSLFEGKLKKYLNKERWKCRRIYRSRLCN